MKTSLLFPVLVLLAPASLPAQFGPKMQDFLRPYTEEAFEAPDGPDADKAFIREKHVAIREALPEALPADPGRTLKVLVLTQGTLGPLHTPAAGGLILFLRECAAKYGVFDITEVFSDNIPSASLTEYDVVVLNNVGMAAKPDFFNQTLPDYVAGGGGLFAVHGTALLFWKEGNTPFNRLLGGHVDSVHAKNGHPLTQHGGAFPVRLQEPIHPIMASFTAPPTPMTVRHRSLSGQKRNIYNVNINPPLTLADELYVLVPVEGQDAPPNVLAWVDRETAPQTYPEQASEFAYALCWTKDVGKGRLFYNQLGHNMAVYTVPMIAAMNLAGLLHAAGVDLPRGTAVR